MKKILVVFVFNLICPFAFSQNSVLENDSTQMRVEEKIEKQPEFKGGINELSKFIKNNTIYPKQALADNISGLVVVKFVVRKDGNLSNIEVAKSLRPDLNQEAIRIVTLSNNLWSPATKNGNKVSANYYLPITFFTSKAAEKKYYKAKQ